MRVISILLCLLLPTLAIASERACGTAHLFEHKHNTKGKSARLFAYSGNRINCEPEYYYDKVLSKKTENFQIFYTLTGPHATFKEYVDSLAIYLESALKFHTQKLKMRTPKGTSTTYHYKQNVSSSLYPVEIIDINLMRNAAFMFDGGICDGCFGLTYPTSDSDPDVSELFIDNDLKSSTRYSPLATLEKDGKKCSYPEADETLSNEKLNEDYSVIWDKGLRVTVFHELYHACQLRYLDLSIYRTFWFEASATGVEEISNPKIDDYFRYLSSSFSRMGLSPQFDNSLSFYLYGEAVLYLYLYNRISNSFDSEIWESYSKKPSSSFSEILIDLLKRKKLNADSVFHDYAVRLSFSGEKTGFLKKKDWLNDDQNEWPEFDNFKEESFAPDTTIFAYSFYTNGFPDLEKYKGNASAILFKDDSYEITPIKKTNTVDSLYRKNKADSIVWVFSRLETSKYMETVVTDSTLKAFPVPWREGSLCFTPLPKDKDYIEIRNRRGAIVLHQKYDRSTFCLEENQVKEKMTPGVYWFRVENKGKGKKFLVIY